MKITDILQQSDKEIKKRIQESREQIRALRFQLASRQLKNVRKLRKAKKEVAQLLTIKRIKNDES